MRSGPPTVRKRLETSRSRERRISEGWYEKYCPPDEPGLDIGTADDPIHDHFDQWDMEFGDGDAVLMEGMAGEKYHTVYASHILEHVNDPIAAIRRWFELVRPGGHLIACVPHRDLYEKRKLLPSRFNADHLCFWLPNSSEPPHTVDFTRTIQDALQSVAHDILYVRVLDRGWMPVSANEHSRGEYAIEAVIRKPDGQAAVHGGSADVQKPAIMIPGERDSRSYILETHIAELNKQIAKLETEIGNRDGKLAAIYGTRTWQWRTKLVEMAKGKPIREQKNSS
jgi:SAM-dependent methyltransferase